MKKVASALAIMAFALVFFASFSSSIRAVSAQADYDIEHVSHTVSVLYNGYVLINDTVRLANLTGASPSAFSLGFPNKYGTNVLRCFAYSGTGNLPVSVDVPLENRVGFYSVEVDFTGGAPQVFTVVTVLSNNLVTQDSSNSSRFTLDFPAYPALTEKAALCNASVVLPDGAQYLGGTVSAFSYGTADLQEFAHASATLQFLLSESKLQILDVASLNREIRINEFGEIEIGDNYKIANKANKEITSIEVMLPLNASNSTAEDQFGRKMTQPTQTNETTNRYVVNLTMAVNNGQSARFTVRYRMPSAFVSGQGTGNMALNLTLFQYEDYYINQTSITVTLPEGARIVNLETALAGFVQSMSRNVFQESLTLSRAGVIATDTIHIGVSYQYNLMWLSFRPTTWVWTLAVVACAIAAVAWKRGPTAPMHVPISGVVKLRSEQLRGFADTYEEKRKARAELESMEDRVQKGKIPRRRYKVRRKMLETRLTTLDRDLEESKARIRAAGGQYLDYMRQLEVAETEINEVETTVKSIEARHERGEITLETYRKMLADYESRKERAETTIDGILLRLRE